MISIMANNGKTTYGVQEYIVDSADDVENLPTENIAPGSTALVIATSSVYVFSNSGEGVEI